MLLIRRFKSKLNQLIKNQIGFSNLEIAIGTMIILTIIMAAIDLSSISTSHNTVSSFANFASQTIGSQGGISPAPPDGFTGDYITPSQLLNSIEIGFNNIGIPRSNWMLLVNGVVLTESTDTGQIPYRDTIDVRLQYTQGFPLFNQMIPGELPNFNRSAHRRVLSSYYYRNDSNPESGDIKFE